MGETYPLYINGKDSALFNRFKERHPRNVSKVIMGLIDVHMQTNRDIYYDEPHQNPRGGDWN